MKSMDAHTLRMLLVARSRLVSQRQATANTIRGLLRPLAWSSHGAAKACFLCAFVSRLPAILH